MSYELLALPLPPGAEIEEAGEALEVRLAGGHVYADGSPEAVRRRTELARVVTAADAALTPERDVPVGRLRLTDGAEISVEIDARFALVRVAYGSAGARAVALFERVFRIVAALVGATGWKIYDPQGACAVDAGDEGRDATLEIYESVVDQLLPERARRPR